MPLIDSHNHHCKTACGGINFYLLILVIALDFKLNGIFVYTGGIFL